METRDARSAQFSHPSDFEQTSISGLSDLDNVLRCQVCKDYFETPTMTSCSHTFCSMCIRQALSSSGQCPTCRKKDQTVHLRRNWPIQEAVSAWKKVRGDVLKTVSADTRSHTKTTNEEGHVNGIKNSAKANVGTSAAKKRAIEAVDDANDNPRYKTRSKKSHDYTPQQAHTALEDLRIEEDDERDQDYEEEIQGIAPAQTKQASKSLRVQCPICREEMLEAQVFGHLDHCTGERKMNKEISSAAPVLVNGSASVAKQQPKATLERITFLSYDLMKETALKKKLQQLGIRADGNKSLMKARHMYWVDLWNANADSDTPRSRRELLDDLAVWERAIGKNQAGGSSSWNQGASGAIMRKDFDRAGYQTQNTNQYNDLIAQARSAMKAKITAPAVATNTLTSATPTATEQNSIPPTRSVPPTAPIPAESMFLGAAAQLNAATARRRGSNAIQYLSSPLHLHHSHSSTDSASGVRQMPLYQMREYMVRDMDEDIK